LRQQPFIIYEYHRQVHLEAVYVNYK